MAIEVFNRYETKFLMDTRQYNILKEEIEKRAVLDVYNKGGKFYTICNVYYDTPDNNLIRASLEKPKYKEKLRLRSYGVPEKDKTVFLEIKKKYDGIVNKRRCSLTIDEASQLVTGHNYPQLKDYMNKQVLDELYYFVNLYNVEPKAYIAYDRLAYAGIEDKDLRITFDTNIRSRRYNVALEKGDYGTNILNSGVWLMEIKCGGALPMWLVSILCKLNIYKTSFSKYGSEYMQYLHNLHRMEGLKYA